MLSFVLITIISLSISYIAERKNSRVGMFLVALILAVYSGLRGPEVGIDTEQYYYFYEQYFG